MPFASPSNMRWPAKVVVPPGKTATVVSAEGVESQLSEGTHYLTNGSRLVSIQEDSGISQ